MTTDTTIDQTMTSDMFNFADMKEVSGDPFLNENTGFAKDERFYTLSKDKEGNGGAIIRLLPDSERGMIQRMFKCNANETKDGKKRFVSEFSPQSIGLPCPFQTKWEGLWNSGQKDEAKKFSRGVTFIANIKVVKDPAAPENEGKIFLYQMSGAIKDKIQKAMNPSEQDVALGATPKEMFNPLSGHSFKLSCSKGANGQINYDSSEIKQEITSIYANVQEAVADIKTNTHTLSGLLAPDQFLSFEELEKKLNWVQFADQQVAPKINTLAQSAGTGQEPVKDPVQEPVKQVEQVAQEPVKPVQEPVQDPEPAKPSNSIDDILNAL